MSRPEETYAQAMRIIRDRHREEFDEVLASLRTPVSIEGQMEMFVEGGVLVTEGRTVQLDCGHSLWVERGKAMRVETLRAGDVRVKAWIDEEVVHECRR